MRRSVAALLVLAAACGGEGPGAPPPGGQAFGLTQRTVVTGLNFPTEAPQPGTVTTIQAFPNLTFSNPLFLTHAGDGTNRLFVVEQAGRIRVFANQSSTNTVKTFLDITARVRDGGERGLLGLAFHPDYETNGFLYVYYSTAGGSGDHRSIVARYSVSAGDPDAADATSETVLLAFDEPYSNHNGGMIAFGPDGKLYIATGDGGSGGDPQNNAQNRTNLLGKILRLNADGSVPADNPFVGEGGGVRGEIWAYGLRNPWRFSFDRDTGDLWCCDVGQNSIEEVDRIVKGGNYGWRLFEGNASYNNPGGTTPPDYVPPLATYDHSFGQSITGGYVYRGTGAPSLRGTYLYGDYASGRIWGLVHDGQQVISNVELLDTSITIPSFGEDEAGEVYICSFNGRIYRFEETGAGGTPFPAKLSDTGLFRNMSLLLPRDGLIEYDVNAPLWSDGARKRRWIALPGTARIGYHATEAWSFPRGTVLVKHFEIETAPGTVRRLETRVLIRGEDDWQGYTYRWNTAQNDADLLPGADSTTFTVQDASAPGGQRVQTWYFPSPSDCMQCHTTAAGRVLGVRTRLLNRDFAYPDATDNQLRSWNHIALFTTDIGDHAQYEALADPADATASLDARARSYLDVNCAMCHRPTGPTPVDMDLRFGVAEGSMRLFGVASTNPANGLPGTLRAAAGTHTASDFWDRMGRMDEYAMPPLGRNLPDESARTLLADWIDSR